MGADGDTRAGEIVYLLAELRSEERGSVYEIGSQARVVGALGDRLTLAVASGSAEDVVTCPSGLVARRQRSRAVRHRVTYVDLPPVA